jgi:hypothetical protein
LSILDKIEKLSPLRITRMLKLNQFM